MMMQSPPSGFNRLLKTIPPALVGAMLLPALLAPCLFAEPTRILPPNPPWSEGVNAPGYCPSGGGIIYWEKIQDVLYHFDDDWLLLTIRWRTLNPHRCGPDSYPDYDGSPEYLNAWIDWDGDHRWDPSEQVADEEFTNYARKAYRGNLQTHARVPMPPVATQK